MNANQLRASILQMAIEGKLVPQLDREPAVEQLGNAPEDVPFDIPEKWKWAKLETISIQTKQKVPDHSFHYIDVSSIKNFSLSDLKTILPVDAPSRARKIVKDGMILYSTVRPYLNNVCVASNINCETIASTAFATFSCISTAYNKYVFYVLISPYFVSYVKSVQQGISYPAINNKQFFSSLIPLPPLEEQKRIVAKLEQLLPLVDEYGKAYEKLEELNAEFPDKLKASVLQSAIKGQLVPQLDSEHAVEQIGKVPEDVPFEIPEKWTFVKLSNISVKVHYGYTASAADKGNYKLLRITDISSGYVNWDTVPFCHVDEKAISKMKLAQNDLVIARSGASVGTAYLIKELKCDAVFASYLIRVIPKLDLVYPKYLEIFCKSPFYWKQIQKSSTGTAQLNVNAKSLNNLDLPLPPLEEQKRIVAKVEEMFALIDAMKK